MPQTIADAFWWFFTGAFGIGSLFLLGFIKFLLNEKIADMKKMKEAIEQIVINTSVIPSLLKTQEAHTQELTELKIKVARLERDKS